MFDTMVVQTAMASLQSAIKSLGNTTTDIEKAIYSTEEPGSDIMAPPPPSKVLLREVSMNDDSTLQEIADLLCKSRKQIVITGAGISTSCGIPVSHLSRFKVVLANIEEDFRSKDGLYKMIPRQTRLPTPLETEPSTPSRRKRAAYTQEEDEPTSKRLKAYPITEEFSCSQTSTLSRSSSFTSTTSRLKGEDLFHARVFQGAETTTMFYQFIASLRKTIRNDVIDTSETHKFIRALRDGGRLMRCYTQNIDGLEEKEALCVDLKRGKGTKTRFTKKIYACSRPEVISDTDFDGGCEVVQLHGELSKLRCRVCSTEAEWTDEDTEIFLEGAAPECEKCADKNDQRQAKGKRGLAVGELRPNIVLYGEDHPQSALITPLMPYDISSNPDVLTIMGTSLKVHGLQKIIRNFAKAVHARRGGRVIFVNRTRPAESVWEGIIDDWVAMDCDEWVRDLKQRKPEIWFQQGDARLCKPSEHTVSRKRKLGNCSHEPSGKRRKVQKFISVDIPRLMGTKHSEAGESISKTTSRVVGSARKVMVNVPPLNRSTHFKLANEQITSLKSTPKQSRRTIWKHSHRHGYEGHGVLSPLVQLRPKSSPLNLHFKCQKVLDSDPEYVPGSPLTPRFSPLLAPNATPPQFIIFDDSVTATPSPHTRVVIHPQIPETALQVPTVESYCVGGSMIDVGVGSEILTPVRRQLSFLDGDVPLEKQVPLYARFGRGVKSLFSTDFLRRAQ